MDLIEIFSKFSNSELINFAVTFAGFIISAIVLYFTVKTWLLKHGQAVRASYGITITDKPYVSSVIIENLKDRDLIIFAIYLKFGANVYLDLLDIDNHYDRYHHIVPSLSTRVFELGEPLYYTESCREVDMEGLLKNWHAGSIILLTNNGKIKAKQIKHGWNPIAQYFKNYGTCYIRPRRFYTNAAVPSSHQQSENYIDYTSYHKGIHYLVTLKFSDGKSIDFEIPPFHRYEAFKKLKFTPEVLSSCGELERYFLESRAIGAVEFEEIIKVVDIKQIIDKDKEKIYCGKVETIKSLNRFNYHVLWKLRTWLFNIKHPNFPSKLFSFYCWLGIRENPNKKKKASVKTPEAKPTPKNKKKGKKKRKQNTRRK